MATLSQLISLPELGLKLVQAGLGDPELTWASTTELLDLGQYLEGGEIVLTTGLGLDGTDARWRDFVAALSRTHIAAIGFGVGVNHDRIPAPLLAAASTYRVALVEVPPPVPFIAVSKAVAGLLHADELHAAQRALQIHQRLLDGARGAQNTADVLASIAQATGRQLAVISADGSPIANTAGFAAHSPDGAGQSVRRDAEQGVEQSLESEIAIDEASGTRLVIAGGEPLGPESRAVVAAGAMVLGLELRGERSDNERERSRWARLTEGVLDGRLDAASAELLDPALTLPPDARAVAVLGSAEEIAAWSRRPRAGRDRLVTNGQAVKPESDPLRGTHSPGTSIAWQICADERAVLSAALTTIASYGLDAVVGRAGSLGDLRLSRQSAISRLSSLSSVEQLYAEPRTPVVVWADGATPILENLMSIAGHQALSRAVLGPLAASSEEAEETDTARRTPDAGLTTPAERRTLRETLQAVLAHNGQRGPAAASLGIHRNTLRDRVQRIERVTGRSLDHPDDRAEIWLALRMESFIE